MLVPVRQWLLLLLLRFCFAKWIGPNFDNNNVSAPVLHIVSLFLNCNRHSLNFVFLHFPFSIVWLAVRAYTEILRTQAYDRRPFEDSQSILFICSGFVISRTTAISCVFVVYFFTFYFFCCRRMERWLSRQPFCGTFSLLSVVSA